MKRCWICKKEITPSEEFCLDCEVFFKWKYGGRYKSKLMRIKEFIEEELEEKLKASSKEEIDNFFYECGWSDSERGDNKALPDWRIQEIQKGKARELLDTFIQETDLGVIIKALRKITK